METTTSRKRFYWISPWRGRGESHRRWAMCDGVQYYVCIYMGSLLGQYYAHFAIDDHTGYGGHGGTWLAHSSVLLYTTGWRDAWRAMSWRVLDEQLEIMGAKRVRAPRVTTTASHEEPTRAYDEAIGTAVASGASNEEAIEAARAAVRA